MNLKDYFKKAQKGKWALGQFNFSALEQLRGIFEAGRSLKSPLILGTSEGEIGFLGLKEIVALTEISKMEYGIPAFLNLDHGKDIDLIKKAIDLGYHCVHFDGSDLPFKENIREIKKIVSYAHKKGVLVEGEFDKIKGSSVVSKSKVSVKDFTLPEKALEFCSKTGVDSLAIAIGSVHGMHKTTPSLNIKRLKEIRKKVNVFLVLHGSSGVLSSDIKKAVKEGIVKVNNNTELRVAWKDSLVKSLNKKEIKPYNILPSVSKGVQKKVEEKIKLFDSKGKI